MPQARHGGKHVNTFLARYGFKLLSYCLMVSLLHGRGRVRGKGKTEQKIGKGKEKGRGKAGALRIPGVQ